MDLLFGIIRISRFFQFHLFAFVFLCVSAAAPLSVTCAVRYYYLPDVFLLIINSYKTLANDFHAFNHVSAPLFTMALKSVALFLHFLLLFFVSRILSTFYQLQCNDGEKCFGDKHGIDFIGTHKTIYDVSLLN